jgi:hypothetical protein
MRTKPLLKRKISKRSLNLFQFTPKNKLRFQISLGGKMSGRKKSSFFPSADGEENLNKEVSRFLALFFSRPNVTFKIKKEVKKLPPSVKKRINIVL